MCRKKRGFIWSLFIFSILILFNTQVYTADIIADSALTFSLNSQADDLAVFDPDGRTCSKNQIGIEGADFAKGDAGQQTVTLPELKSGQLKGKKNETCELTITSFKAILKLHRK